MRVKCMCPMDGVQKFYRAKNNIKTVVLAGRFLASVCCADPSKETYGFEDIPGIQAGLDTRFVGKFNIIVHKIMSGKLIRVYEGNRQNHCVIPILMNDELYTTRFYGIRNNFICNTPVAENPSVRGNEERMKMYYTYRVFSLNGSEDIVVPPPYCGPLSGKPVYRSISRKDFDRDMTRFVPRDYKDLQNKIVPICSNIDQYGLSTFFCFIQIF